MKVLSIKQPWAWLIVNGHKDIENRTWRTEYRGQVLIHAGKGIDWAACAQATKIIGPNMPAPEILEAQAGGIVGLANIVDCVTDWNSPWFTGPIGLVLRYARPLKFTPLRGQLGLFNVDAIVGDKKLWLNDFPE